MRNAMLMTVVLSLASSCKTDRHIAAFEAPRAGQLALGYSPTGEETAILQAQAGVTSAPGEAAPLAALARAFLLRYREAGNPRLIVYCRDALGAAASIQPRSKEVLIVLALLHREDHRFSELASVAVELIEAAPRDPVGYLLLGDAKLELGLYDEAVDAVQQALDLAPDARAYGRGAHLRWLLGDWDGSIELMEDALQTAASPETRAYLWVDLGIMHLERGNLDAAALSASRARSLLGDYLPAAELDARVAESRGDYETAEKRWLDVTARRPSVRAYLGAHRARLALGDDNGAVAMLDRALAMRRHDPLALASYFGTTGERAELALELAIRAYEERQTIDSADTLAVAHWRVGNKLEALRLSEEATRLGSLRADLFLHRARIELSVGLVDRAQQSLERARDINPTSVLGNGALLAGATR